MTKWRQEINSSSLGNKKTHTIEKEKRISLKLYTSFHSDYIQTRIKNVECNERNSSNAYK